MKDILMTTTNGVRVFITHPIDMSVIKAEKKYGITIEPTGLIDDEFGLSYVRKHGKVYKSLKEFTNTLTKH